MLEKIKRLLRKQRVEVARLCIVMSIEGEMEQEMWQGETRVPRFAQASGIRQVDILRMILETLEQLGLSPEMKEFNRVLHMENYLRKVATISERFGMFSSKDFDFLQICKAQNHFTFLCIDERLAGVAGNWQVWLHKFCGHPDFCQAWLVAAPVLSPGKEIEDSGPGFVRKVAERMWLGRAFWNTMGQQRQEKINSLDWVRCEDVNTGVISLQVQGVMDAAMATVLETLLYTAPDNPKPPPPSRFTHLRQVKYSYDLVACTRSPDPGSAQIFPPLPPRHPDGVAVGFDLSDGWTAVACDDIAVVAKAIGLRDPVWMLWQDYGNAEIALFPPINGWILIRGLPLGLGVDMGESSWSWGSELSESVGEAQQFIADSGCGCYHWARWRDRLLLRRMTYMAGRIEQVGKITGIEENILLPLVAESELISVAEADVVTVAQSWSVAPNRIPDRKYYQVKDSHVLAGWIPES